jgi:hypothetical protein
VLGLIAGWGTVALHGREGFRAQNASVVCLFTDWAWRTRVPNLAEGWLERWLGRADVRLFNRRSGPRVEDPDRTLALRSAAQRYEIPLVSLQGALELRVLGEWGIPPRRIQEVEAWVSAAAAPTGDG